MGTVVTRKYLPLTITGVVALIMIVEYYLHPSVVAPVRNTANQIRELSNIIGIVAVFLAVYILAKRNVDDANRAKTVLNKFLALELVGIIGITIAIGLIFGVESGPFGRYIEYFYTAASIAIAATDTLWQFYGAYRALRFRSLDGAALVISSLVTMVGMSGWGRLYIPGAEAVGVYLMDTINASVSRGVVIGGGIGSAIAAFRTVIGRERAFISGE